MSRLPSEDVPMLRGSAQFTADLPVPQGALHAWFVRSHVAHGRLLSVQAAAAEAAEGVAAVFTHDDLGLGPLEYYRATTLNGAMARPLLASGGVRFAGEPVAVVLASSVAAAVDAAELVEVDIEPLPAVVDPDEAMRPDAPLLYPDVGTNTVRPLDDTGVEVVAAAVGAPAIGAAGRAVAGSGEADNGSATADLSVHPSAHPSADPCEGAATVVELTCENPRVTSAPIEPDAVLVTPAPDPAPDPAGGPSLTVTCTGQGVHMAARAIARHLKLARGDVRVRHPMVGGGFGGRGDPPIEFFVVARCAQLLGVPVRWEQSRSEQFASMPHGRGQRHRIRLGLSAEGDIVGLDATMTADAGAYPHMAPILAAASRRQFTGMYRVPRFRYRYASAVTNTPPVGAYRGAGQPEVNAALERAIDAAARAGGFDPIEVRRRNLLTLADWPYDTGLGVTLDSGDPVAALDAALEAVDAEAWQAEAARRRSAGADLLIGVGVGCYSQTAGSGTDADYAAVELADDGSVLVTCGSAGHGQAHHSAWARLVEAGLGVAADAVAVTDADSAATPSGSVTGGSRTAFVLGSQVQAAARALRTQLLRVAAQRLEAAEADLVTTADCVAVAGVPSRGLSWVEVAAAASADERRAVSDERIGGPTHPYGTHASVVEVDRQTGAVTLLAHAAVDDCGVALDPEVVEGQQHGGAAAGISQALMEGETFAADGTPLTATFADYLIAATTSLPNIATVNPGAPTERNPLGARGIGENGAIAAPPAVQNAVIDALAHLGVTHIDIPLAPQRVLEAIQKVDQSATELG